MPQAPTPADIDRHVRRALHAGSSLYHLDAELLERLAPDLIVTQELCEVCTVSYSIVDRAARRLANDPRILSLEPSSLEDVYANIGTLGELTERRSGATAVIEALRERERAARDTVAGKPRSRVLLLEWTEPFMSAGHWSPGLIEAAGGIPVLANPGANSQVVTIEQIAAADPDQIIVAPCGFDMEKTRAAVAELDDVSGWRDLRAVRGGRLYCVDGNAYVNRPGPRLIDTIEIFAQLLHT